MKIYTKRGDSGLTDLFGGDRVKKNHPRVKAYGSVDAANSAVGLAYSSPDINADLKVELKKIMAWLFCAGAEIATAPKDSAHALLDRQLKNQLGPNHIAELELSIDTMEANLSPLKNFILPCGSDTSARLHLARNLVREAELRLLDLSEEEPLRADILIFFNRLSDYLFVAARRANHEAGEEDIGWNGQL